MQLNEHIFEIVTEFVNAIDNVAENPELKNSIKSLIGFCRSDVKGDFSPADELVYGALTRIEKIWNLVSEGEIDPTLSYYYNSLFAYLQHLYCDKDQPLDEIYSNEVEVDDDAFDEFSRDWSVA